MKKKLRFFALLAALMVPWAASAQTVVTIGDGGTTTSNYLPAYTYYNNNLTEQIYTSAEVGVGGTITSIAFFNGGTEMTPNIKLYLVNTTQTEFSSTYSWLPVTANDLVFEGNVTFVANQWTTITLNTPFVYDGVSNLGVIVDESMPYTSGLACRVFTSTSNCAMYVYSDGTDYDAVGASYYGYRTGSKNQIQLTISSGDISCYAVRNLAVVDSLTTSSSLTISWLDTVNSGASYNVYLINGADTTLLANVSDTSFTIDTLRSNTEYTFGVQADCGNDGTGFMMRVSGRTACGLITGSDLPWSDNLESYAPSTSASAIPCWNGFSYGYTSYLDYPKTDGTAGVDGANGKSLRYYFGSTAQRQIAVLPRMDDLASLMLTFYIKGNASASYEVGVMTNPNDTTTFTALTGLTAVPTNWTYVEVPLADADDAEYIAIRGRATSSYNGFYIDELSVVVAPACQRPAGIAIRNVETESANLFIDDATSNNNYGITLISATDTVELTATDTVYALDDLTPNTEYTVTVVSNCSDGTTTVPHTTTFRTACVYLTADDLPYTMNFDSLEASNNTVIPCWNKLSFNSSYPNHPTVSTSYHNSGANSLYFYPGYNYQPIFATLPAFDDLSGLMLRFSWLMATQATLQVGTMSDPMDTTTFTALLTIPAGNGTYNTPWTEVELSLAGTAADAHYVAFRAGVSTSYGYSIYVDDVVLMEQPDCMRPNSVYVDSITATTAILHIVDPSEAMNYAVVYGNDSIVVTDTVYLLEDLSPSSEYSVRVRTICSDDEPTDNFVSTSFSTPCVNITVTATEPYTESFDNWGTNFNRCWDRLYLSGSYYGSFGNTSSTYLPVISSTMAHTGSNSLRMYSSYEYDYYDDYEYEYSSYAFMPVFEAPMSSLTMSFWYRVPSDASNITLAVGVSSTVNDSSTFTRLTTIRPADTSWHQYEVDLGAYSGTGDRITFYQTYSGYDDGTFYGYIDDIQVGPLGDCVRPAAITVSEISATSVTLTWVDINHTDNYKVVVNGDEASAETAYDTVITLTVEADSVYTVAVSTLCGSEYTEARTITFKTPCLPIAHDDLPWSENFDAATSGSSVPLAELGCMKFIQKVTNGYGTYYYPYANGNFRYGDAGNSLYFSSSAGEPQIAVLPLFEDDLSSLMFSAQVYRSGVANALVLGVMSNPSDPATFVVVDTLLPDTTNQWSYVEHSFANYDGNGGFIAIRPLTTGSSNYTSLYIDNLSVSEVVECQRVQGVSLTALSATEVTIEIADSLEQNDYRVWLTSTTDTTVRTEDVSTNTVTFSDLVPNTAYTVHVSTLCGGSATAPVDFSFTTPCTSFDMPWSENFDILSTSNGTTYLANNCWNFYYNAQVDSVIAGSARLSSSSSTYRSIRSSEGSGFTTNHLVHNVYSTGNYAWTVTPSVNIEGTAALSFDVALTRWNNGTAPGGDYADDRFVVAITSDNGLTWTALIKWGCDTANRDDFHLSTLTTAGQTVSIPLDNYDGETVRIAFYTESTVAGDDNSLRIDNVIIESASCMVPLALTLDSASTTTATISWTSDAASFEYQYAPDNDTTTWTSGTTADVNVTLSGLSASTGYIFRVRTVCGTDSSRWVSFTFRTACGAITALPWTEGFENYIGGSYASTDNRFDPDCWTVLNRYSSYGSTSNYPYVYNSSYYVHSGANCLNFYGNANPATIMVLPEFQEDLSNLQLNFWMSGGTSYSVQVGYMTDPNDQNTFVSVQTCQPTVGYTYQEFEVSFPDTATGRIAFRYNYSYSGYSIYIDDITVDHVPACARPSSVVASNVTETSADLAICDANNVNHYYVVYGSDSVEVNGTTYTLNNLSPSSNYIVRVYTICEDGSLNATPTTVSFQTACGAITALPWTEDFESMAINSAMPCWGQWYETGNAWAVNTGKVFVASGEGYGNSKGLKIRADYYTTPDTAMAILPTFSAQANQLEVSYMLKRASSLADSSYYHVDFGVVTDPSDPSTFVSFEDLGTLPITFTQYTHNLSSYAGADGNLAFRFVYTKPTDYWWIWIDSIVVDYNNNTPQPTQYTVSLATSDASMGTVSPAGTTTVNAGSSFTATATPANNHIFTGWVNAAGDTVSFDNPYIFTVNANVSLTGTFRYDGVGIESAEAGNISLFPNPATGMVTVSGIEAKATVTLVDINGHTAGQWTADEGSLTIDLAGYATGTYFVRIVGEQGVAVLKLIVK